MNTAASDLNVQDGFCEKFHNLRYSAGSWRPIPYFRLKWSIAGYGGFRIVYRHPAASAERYIALSRNNSLYEVRVDRGKVASTQILLENMEDFRRCSHFGNVLIVRMGDADQRYFVLEDGHYKEFFVPSPVQVSASYSYKPVKCTYIKTGLTCIPIGTGNTQTFEEYIPYYRIMNISTGELFTSVNDGTDDYWHGELLLLAAYRMTDGTTIAPSPLYLLHSDGSDNEARAWKMKNNLDASDTINAFLEIFKDSDMRTHPKNPIDCITQRLQRCMPKITVKVNKSGWDKTLVSSVTLYCTRINSIYDYEKIAKGSIGNIVPNAPVNFLDIYADHKLPDQPFYLLREIKPEEFDEAGLFTFDLGYSQLKDIVSKTAYEPMQSLHKIAGNVFYDYNGRMHIADITATLFDGYDLAETRLDANINTYLATALKSEGKTYHAIKTYVDESFVRFKSGILSYPDYRATEIRVLKTEVGGAPKEVGRSVSLSAAMALNYAYYLPAPTDARKYPDVLLPSEEGATLSSLPGSRQIVEHNRLQVSAANNVFAFPFAQSYALGRGDDTTIKAVAAAADQLSEGRFGAFPLYVFTTAGVWALENGQGEVLYSNTVPVNHDVVINSACASARNAVFYITSRGLHAVQGRDSKIISSPLEDELDKLYGYFQNSVVQYLFSQDELIVYNRDYDYAYVYSLTAGYWSTRDMQGTILDCSEVVSGDRILDIQEYNRTKCLPRASVVTRPIKFESVEFKRLETLIVRLFSAYNVYADLTIEGSQDCKKWLILRHEILPSINWDVTIRRTPCSAKFFRVKLEMNVTPEFLMDRLDTEFYHRFLHRLR